MVPSAAVIWTDPVPDSALASWRSVGSKGAGHAVVARRARSRWLIHRWNEREYDAGIDHENDERTLHMKLNPIDLRNDVQSFPNTRAEQVF